MSSTALKRRHLKKSKKQTKVTSVPNDKELCYLEKIVLKTGSEVFDGAQSGEISDDETPIKKGKTQSRKKPAWVDEDDEKTFEEVVKEQNRKIVLRASKSKKYQNIMEQKYEQVMGVPKWSRKNYEKEIAGDLLNTCGKFIKKPNFLEKGILEYKVLKHVNFETYAEGAFINVIKFHPKSTVAMVAGNSGVLSLFQVNGKNNPKLQSLHFENYPIKCGSFLRNGEEVLLGSQYYSYFYSHNLMTGKSSKIQNSKIINIRSTKNFCVSPNDNFIAVIGNSGTIFLFTVSTKEYIGSFQMNCDVTAINFNHDGSLLYSHGEDGEVYIWDMKSRTCIKKFIDDGCLVGTSICTSNSDQFIASGSSFGVVNIYDTKTVHSGTHKPMKTIYNLVTPVTSLQFNSTNEIMVMASDSKEAAVKVLHCPSMSIFSNFPQFTSKIYRPLCVDFSPNSGFLAIGDNKGIAHLIRLKYYGNY